MMKTNNFYNVEKAFDIATKKEVNDTIIANGQTMAVNFDNDLDLNYNYRLYLDGEVDVPYVQRFEGIFPNYYRKLDNSIIEKEYGKILVLDKNNEVYERTFATMIRNGFCGKKYNLSIRALVNGLKNEMKVTAEIYYGESRTRYYYEQPDKIVEIKLENSKHFVTYNKDFIAENKIDFIMIKFSALDFSGNAELFAPELINEYGENICYPFDKNDPDKIYGFNWVGEGFSLIERPYFNIKVNGENIFSGRKMDAIQRYSGIEFLIPENALNKINNQVEITCNHNIKAYKVRSVQLRRYPKGFKFLGVKPYLEKDKEFGVFFYSDKQQIPQYIKDNIFEYVDCIKVKEFGVIKMRALHSGKNLPLSFNVDGEVQTLIISGVIEKTNEFIITGTGDFIYVNQNLPEFAEYLSWYLNNGIGDLLTFRCVYHWGRASELDVEFWKDAVKLLNALGIYYSVMADGRELNGVNANPDDNILNTPYYLGRQTHERDGAYTYWDQGIDSVQEVYYHLLSRKIKYNGQYGRHSPVYDENKTPYLFYVQNGAKNVKEAYENFVANIKFTAEDGATRHTGVTPLFHTFFEAGYKWIGYESMYGPHELLLGSMRATAQSFNKPITGTHLALQWSSVPTDDARHFIRYKLSLYLSYMHGVSEINTEEGLYRIENPFTDFDRYSYACVGHRIEQSKFNKFIKTHSRRGVQRVNIAMLQGNYDGFECFSSSNVYGQKEWATSTPEKSWDLVKVFYPESDLSAIYYYIREGGEKNMPQKDKELLFDVRPGLYKGIIDYKQVGFYTNTPYGVIDVLPPYVGDYSKYKFLFFTGWNTATDEQLEKLCKYVEDGGCLLLAKPHLYDTVDRNAALTGKATVLNSSWTKKLLSYVSTGRVFYFDRNAYPIEYKDEYSEIIKKFAKSLNSGIITDTKYLSYTEYDLTDGAKMFYLLNINWWNNEPACYTLNISNKKFIKKIHGNEPLLLYVKNEFAVYTDDLFTDIIGIKDDILTLNGFGSVNITLIHQQGERQIRKKLNGITNIKI